MSERQELEIGTLVAFMTTMGWRFGIVAGMRGELTMVRRGSKGVAVRKPSEVVAAGAWLDATARQRQLARERAWT